MTRTQNNSEDDAGVLIVEDQVGDLRWLTDLIETLGYKYVVAASEKQAKERLDAVAKGTERYTLAIVDVMVSTYDIDELLALPDLDHQYFQDSRNTGIRLCEHARLSLNLSPEKLPILCCTVRDDDEVAAVMARLSIPYFRKDYDADESLIRDEIRRCLPPRH